MMFFLQRLLLILFLLTIASPKLFSQSNIGLMIGPQFSDHTQVLPIPKIQHRESFRHSTFVGFLMGMSFREKLKNKDYLQIELLYSMRGERFEYHTIKLSGRNVINFINESESSLRYFFDYRSHYLEVPVLYSWNVMKNLKKNSIANFYLSSGFSLGVNVLSNTIYNSFKLKSPGATVSGIDEDYHEEKFDHNNPLLLNYLADLEIEFNTGKVTRLFMSGRYNHSLTQVYKKEYDDLSTRVSSAGFNVGLRWYLNRATATADGEE